MGKDDPSRKFSYKLTTRDETAQTIDSLRYMKPGFQVEFQSTDGDPFAFGIIDKVGTKHMNVCVDDMSDASELSKGDIIIKISYSAGTDLYVAHTGQIRGNNITIDKLVSINWEDRRKDKRFDCNYTAVIDKPVYDSHGEHKVLNFTPALIKDISLTGAYIVSSQPVIGNGTIEIIDSTNSVSIPFNVARRGKTKNGYGIHFLSLNPEAEAQIHRMMFDLEDIKKGRRRKR